MGSRKSIQLVDKFQRVHKNKIGSHMDHLLLIQLTIWHFQVFPMYKQKWAPV